MYFYNFINYNIKCVYNLKIKIFLLDVEIDNIVIRRNRKNIILKKFDCIFLVELIIFVYIKENCENYIMKFFF